jgi:hypothetical protein
MVVGESMSDTLALGFLLESFPSTQGPSQWLARVLVFEVPKMIIKYSCWSATGLFAGDRFFAASFYDMSFSFSWKIPAQESMERSNAFGRVCYNSRNWRNGI